MDKYVYRILDNSDVKLHYTILHDDRLVQVYDGDVSVFIELIRSREKQPGKLLSHEY